MSRPVNREPIEPMQIEGLIGGKAAGKMLGLSARTLEEWCKRGKCPFRFYFIASMYKFDPEDIRAYIRTCAVSPRWEESA